MVKGLTAQTNTTYIVNHVGEIELRLLLERWHTVGRIKGEAHVKERKDKGTKRDPYNTSYDDTGKTSRENKALKSFWCTNKVADMMELSPEELDAKIDQWMAEYEARQIKRVKGWWYPELYYEKTPKKAKGPRKINHEWNTSFGRK